MNKKILCMLTPILVLPFFVLGKKANAYNIVEQPIVDWQLIQQLVNL